jgi:hypothetical protein
VEDEDGLPNNAIMEEEEHEEEERAGPDSADSDPTKQTTTAVEDVRDSRALELQSARKELSKERFWALLSCFAGPMLGGYLVHTLRSHLSRPSEGLVSNINLTIFIIIAEFRPVRQLIKLKKGHIDRIQQILRPDSAPTDRLTKAEVAEMRERLADVEAKLAVSAGSNGMIDARKVSVEFKQGIQPQLDALNRAVRRYEKRQTAQGIQIEARFADMEIRLKDSLALAAAAARTGQQPGIVSMALTGCMALLTSSLQTFWSVVSFPFSVAGTLVSELKSWVFPRRRAGKRMQTRSEHPSLSTARAPSRIGKGYSAGILSSAGPDAEFDPTLHR